MENSSLISIIIPVYNTELFLKRCMDAVLKQSYKNLEVILVDDGSTDSSSTICDSYSSNNKNVTVYHKKNGGLSDARNFGIEKANGNYIFFLDSDDWISCDAIQFLYKKLTEYEADISCGYFQFSKKNDTAKQKKYKTICCNCEKALEHLMYTNNYFTHSACGKLYKAELFKNIRYPKGRHFEDLGTTYKLFSISNKIVTSNKPIYYYYQNPKSIMHQKYSHSEYDRIRMAEEELEYIQKYHPTLEDAAIFRLCYECCNILGHIPKNTKEINIIKGYLKKYRTGVLRDKNVSIKRKIIIFSSVFGRIGLRIAFISRKIKGKG